MAITYETTIGALSKEDKALAQLIMPREGFSSSVYSDVDSFVTERFNVFETILKEYTKSVDVIPTTP